jgi:hypothetical protein
MTDPRATGRVLAPAPRAAPPDDPLHGRLQRVVAARAMHATQVLDPTTGKLPPGEDSEGMNVTGIWEDFVGLFRRKPAPTPTPATATTTTSTPTPTPAPTPPKLSHKTDSAATGSDCGTFKWVVQWMLDKPSPKGGWVVQQVGVTRNVKDCADKVSGPDDSGGLNTAWYPLWEAWKVNPGKSVTTYAEGADTEDDTYSQGLTKPTKGSVTVTGSAEFYEGLVLPGSFKVTNKAPTWILPATNAAPTLAGGTGAIPHSLTATWNCCTGSDKTTTVTPT